MEIKKYYINEGLAKAAKESYSYFDYIPNSATNEYHGYLQKFSEAVERLIERHGATPEQMETIEYYADRYSMKLADAINRDNKISTMCPSILVAGGSNFPVQKKERQNRVHDNFVRECGELFYPTNNYYYDKIKTLLTNKTIYSNDALAIEKLQHKLSDLEESHARMKAQNAYYRKHGTMKGFEEMTDEEAEEMDNRIKSSMWNNQPYPPYFLTSNNAEMKRIKARIAEITKLKEEAAKPLEDKYPAVDGVEVVENAEAMRVQLIFDDKPDDETRALLKSYGFRWSPSYGAWQRQLTANGISAAKSVLNKLLG